MKRTAVFLMVGVAAFLMLTSTPGFSGYCTVFTASVGDTTLFGNNEDVGDRNATVWFVPATEKCYGWVYFGFSDYPIPDGHFPMGGMNEQGLCFDITSIPESPMRPYPTKLQMRNAGVFGERILEHCKSVEEAAQFIKRYDLSSFGDLQFLFADQSGTSIVLCPGTGGEMKAIQKEGVYQVITNFNMLNTQLGGHPCWRYNAAVRMLSKIESEDDLTVEYFVDVLKSTYTRGTTYSTIYDPVHGVIFLYNKHDFSDVAVFNLRDELEKGYHTYDVPSLFPEEDWAPDELEESEASEEIAESEEDGEDLLVAPALESHEDEIAPISSPIVSGQFALPACTILIISLGALIALVYRKGKKGRK